MNRRRAWALVLAGLILQALVFILPLTPWPLVHLALDRNALEFLRGFQKLIDTGIWKEGDPGFALLRDEYMRNMARNMHEGTGDMDVLGQTLESFRLGEAEGPDAISETRPVYVIFSNLRGHINTAQEIKLLYTRFRQPHAGLVNLALIILGSFSIYAGLARMLRPALFEPATKEFTADRGNALSAVAGS